ncbi:MAG TPA: MOSC domain-containing protein [Nocardioides sp.]|nr:MOSC domain-containing protein [Nocardioides sp.]
MPSVISVNVGAVRDAPYANLGFSAMDKNPRSGPVAVRALGLDGDAVGDTKNHGGIDQAVYVFAREDLDWWARELGQEIRNGMFAENLTTQGIDVNEAEVGERWRIGTAELEVASVRIPCNDFKNWMGLGGFDNQRWVKRFTQVGRPGPYLRIRTEGELAAGDEITVLHRPGHGVTVSTMFRALTTEADLLPELLKVDGLVAEARAAAEKRAAAGLG